MGTLARCKGMKGVKGMILVTSLGWVSGAVAEQIETEIDAPNHSPDYIRTGYYIGLGGTAAFPRTWDSDFDNALNEDASELADANAITNRNAIPSGTPLEELSVQVSDSELEDPLMGVNALIGYRAGQRVAFELEAEWLIDSNKGNLNVFSQTESNLLASTSTGTHTNKVESIWTITANMKVYPPLTGRYQPFVKVGLGMQHSKLDVDVTTTGLATTDTMQLIVVPADFRIRRRHTNIDGAVRVAGGIDIYATENILAEINAGIVVPFSRLGPVVTEYVAIQWRLIYRF